MGNNEQERWKTSAQGGSGGRDAHLEMVSGALAGLRFGSVLLTVHEGKIVQMDITEKRRLP